MGHFLQRVSRHCPSITIIVIWYIYDLLTRIYDIALSLSKKEGKIIFCSVCQPVGGGAVVVAVSSVPAPVPPPS
jgi:hypothetical protein